MGQLWQERIEKQNAKKILFVLSDGARLDDSTSSVNPANFLPKHLAAVAVDRVPWRGVAECGSPHSPALAGSVSWRLPEG